MRFATSAALLLLAFSTPAPGGKPSGGGEGSPSTTDPQVGYIHMLSNGGRELRLANEDGTGSALLLSTRSNILAFGLGLRAGHQVAYSDGSTVHLLTYEITSTGPVVRSEPTSSILRTQKATQLRFLAARVPDRVRLSGRNLYVYHIGSGQTSLAVQPHGDIGVSLHARRRATQCIREPDGVDH